MEILKRWFLRGPNVWANFPVLQIEIDLGALKDTSSEKMPGFNDRLKGYLPSLIEHRCSIGERGGFFQRLERGTYLAHILEHVTLELQTLAGSEVGYGRARETDREGVYHVAIEYEEEALVEAAVDAGRALCLACVQETPFDIEETLAQLRDLTCDAKLGPSTTAIVAAARRRGIPATRLNRESLVQLGYGAMARRICTAETDRTGAIAEVVAQDKELTRLMLNAVGVPVPAGRPVANAEAAWEAAQDLGLPVVVKPQYGNHGRGVATNLSTRSQVMQAFDAAREEGSHIMVEQFIEGDDYRLLVIDGKLVAAALRTPANVVGNGRSTIAELVAEVNRDPRRSDGHGTVLSYIKLDTVGLAVLAEQGYNPTTIPPAGERVLIRRNGNLSTGGTAADVTELVHPEVAARAVDAARAVGLDIAGVDVVARDIRHTLESQRAGVVEVNAGPGLRMHLQPSAGKPQPVGEAIVASLFPPGDDGRIPIVAVAGSERRSITSQLITHLLKCSGKFVAHTSHAALELDGRRLLGRQRTSLLSARAALLNPRVEAAVFDVDRDEIATAGLPFDRCLVAVVTDVGDLAMHAPENGLSSSHPLRQLRTVVDTALPHGFVVLNADERAAVEMAAGAPAPSIYFTRDASQPPIGEHLRSGGRAVFLRDSAIVLASADEEIVLGGIADRLAELPIECVLAAAAAAWGGGVPVESLRAGLESFVARAAHRASEPALAR